MQDRKICKRKLTYDLEELEREDGNEEYMENAEIGMAAAGLQKSRTGTVGKCIADRIKK